MKRLACFGALLITAAVAVTPALSQTSHPQSGTLGIPPGTKITQQNWRQYQQFMGDGMKAVFEGNNYWHMPKDLVIEVGPTVSVPLPKQYVQDSEKYGSQTTLEKLPTGGFVPKDYVAGVPFPNPLKGDPAQVGQRVFWDAYYHYNPRVQYAENYSYTMDTYGNMSQTSEIIAVYSQLTHLSDPGFPQTLPNNGGFFFAKYSQQVTPEQGKYFAILDLIPNDPSKLDELYEYVPSLRRSLRVTAAARCAPLYGTDMDIDDDNEGPPGLPQLYDIKYLGEKKILHQVHGNPAQFDAPGTPTGPLPEFYYLEGKGIVPFLKPSGGPWELRDSYVIEVDRLPQFARGYCYGKRVLYVDKELYFTNQVDLYDAAGKLYKWLITYYDPVKIPGTGGDVMMCELCDSCTYVVNFQDEHATVFFGLHGCLNNDCDKYGYLNIERYASPDGMMKIMQ